MILLILIALALVTGCATDPRIVITFQPETPAALQEYVWEGVAEWGRDATISITFAPASEITGYAGLAIGCDVTISDGLTPLEMVAVAAHEAGHCIFSTSDHLPAYERGIMSPAFGGADQLTDADRAWAEAHEGAP